MGELRGQARERGGHAEKGELKTAAESIRAARGSTREIVKYVATCTGACVLFYWKTSRYVRRDVNRQEEVFM